NHMLAMLPHLSRSRERSDCARLRAIRVRASDRAGHVKGPLTPTLSREDGGEGEDLVNGAFNAASDPFHGIARPVFGLVCAVSILLALSIVGISPSRGQEASSNGLPLVWVLSTGGTIAGAGASSTNVAEYTGGTILGEELVRAVP